MASALAGYALTTTEEAIFVASSDGGRCTEFFVHCRTGSANPALVNVPGLHVSGEFAGIPAGESVIFKLGTLGIARVNAKGSGGAATIDAGVSARTP